MKKIYTLTMIADIDDEKSLVKNSRTFGWMEKLDDMHEIVEKDCHFIRGEYYQYAVIEGTPEGMFALAVEEYWYKWDNDTKKYKSIDKPSCLKMIVSFGIG